VGLEPAIPRKIRKKINLRPTVEELIASEDNTGENAQTYAKDDNGKVVAPRQNVFPNPSDIVNELPPGSDTSIVNALSEQESQDLHNAESVSTPPPAPAPASGSVPPRAPTPAPVPNAVPPPIDTAAPVENPEDGVQPDPDLVDPNAAPGRTPAGPPKK
jgi:hypothetical protein